MSDAISGFVLIALTCLVAWTAYWVVLALYFSRRWDVSSGPALIVCLMAGPAGLLGVFVYRRRVRAAELEAMAGDDGAPSF